ncbi:hypothetical protein CK203_114018 [Vitis vinifera]|uniref:BHLH domain-containing protein n=1 Tax=Vitis vinifera TaxID=29760 RepID=A0A438FF41_VITVI|nr:hypothetical protein CK203_114018 [Vitis vinifera]
MWTWKSFRGFSTLQGSGQAGLCYTSSQHCRKSWRTRISDRIRKLQELVPNMDKSVISTK